MSNFNIISKAMCCFKTQIAVKKSYSSPTVKVNVEEKYANHRKSSLPFLCWRITHPLTHHSILISALFSCLNSLWLHVFSFRRIKVNWSLVKDDKILTPFYHVWYLIQRFSTHCLTILRVRSVWSRWIVYHCVCISTVEQKISRR